MNWNLISLILACLVAAITLLQICWDYLLKNIFKDGRTNENKFLRKGLLIITLILFILNQLANFIGNYNKDKQAKADNRDLNYKISGLTNQLTKSEGKLDDLQQAIRTDTRIPEAVRMTLLSNELKNISEQQDQLLKSHELFNAEAPDIETLRTERQSDLALLENKKKQAALQQEIENIQKQKAADAAELNAEQAAKDQQWADEELIKSEKLLANQILPVFDFTISELDKMLAKYSDETGQARYSDFAGETPSVYASNLVKNGLIVNGINTIGLGTNPVWNFRISTKVASIGAIPNIPPPVAHIPPSISIRFQEPYINITISCQATNAQSTLIITPSRSWNYNIGPELVPVADRLFYGQISIKLNVPNELNIDEIVSVENSKAEITKALHRLIEAQDQQAPLILKTGK
jgi:hypothetical protein